jgi:phage tail-like protein
MSDKNKDSEQNSGPAGFPRDFGWLTLRRKSGQEARRTINRSEYRIGREIGNELTLPDPVISRDHARIRCSPEGCQIEDLGSANGTYLNDERLPANEPRTLVEGDVIRVGDYTLIYHEPQPVEAEMDDEEFVLTFAEAEPSPDLPDVPQTWPLPPRSSYLKYLPSYFSKDSLMDRFLLIFESILAPIEQMIDHVPLVMDPHTMPADLLPWVASWLDLTLNENWPEERRRELIRAASELYRWRGTRQGMSHYLETYAGVVPEIDDQLEKPHTFAVTLRVPADQPVDEYLVRAIIEAEKPAHTAYELNIMVVEPEPQPEPKPAKDEKPPAAKKAPKKKAKKASKEPAKKEAEEKPAEKAEPKSKKEPEQAAEKAPPPPAEPDDDKEQDNQKDS